jgi:hypothetical protein
MPVRMLVKHPLPASKSKAGKERLLPGPDDESNAAYLAMVAGTQLEKEARCPHSEL